MPKNKKYIDDVLKKNPDFVFYDYDNECVGDDLIKLIKEVEQNSLKNFVERLRGDLILHPDLENLNEIITKRLDKIIKN